MRGFRSIVLLWCFAACSGGDGNTDSGAPTPDTADTADTGTDTADTGTDTSDTGADTGADTGTDTGADTADTGTDTGADTADTADTGTSEVFVGCTGASGSCDGLSANACAAGAQLGCDVTYNASCFRRIYCITELDGCPANFCTGSGSTCAFRDAAAEARQEACSTHTTYEACEANFCTSSNVTPACSGTWSCDISFAELPPEERPDEGSCDSFDAVGFACDPVYE